jgi:hypothetical protein
MDEYLAPADDHLMLIIMHRGDGDLMNGSTLAGHRPYHWRLRLVVGENAADYCQ